MSAQPDADSNLLPPAASEIRSLNRLNRSGLGIDPALFRRFLKGKSRWRRDYLEKVAEGFEMSLEELLTGPKPHPRSCNRSSAWWENTTEPRKG